MKTKLFIERDQLTDEWLVLEQSRYGEAIRGRYATELEAAMRLSELHGQALRPPPLPVEEITGDEPPPNRPRYTRPKHISIIYNNPENCWLVLGGPNNHNVEILGRFSTKRRANSFVKTHYTA